MVAKYTIATSLLRIYGTMASTINEKAQSKSKLTIPVIIKADASTTTHTRSQRFRHYCSTYLLRLLVTTSHDHSVLRAIRVYVSSWALWNTSIVLLTRNDRVPWTAIHRDSAISVPIPRVLTVSFPSTTWLHHGKQSCLWWTDVYWVFLVDETDGRAIFLDDHCVSRWTIAFLCGS